MSAPGVDIASPFRDASGEYGYALANGTSMAAPHVAGCAALMMSANPALGPATIESLLESTAVDLGTGGWDAFFGVGRINCATAVTQASTAPTPIPATATSTPSVTPAPTPGTPTITTTPAASSTLTFTATPTASSTPIPATSTPTNGQPTSGSSASLNGSTAYVEAPHHAELTPSSWTFELWFRDENPSYNHPRTRILTKGDITSTEVPYFASIGSNQLTVGLRSGGNASVLGFNLATGGVTPDAWHHLAASFNGSTRQLIVYIDGVQRAQSTLAFTSTGNSLPLIVGRSGALGEYFRGKLDDLRIWNVVRTAAEINGAYQNELSAAPAGLGGELASGRRGWQRRGRQRRRAAERDAPRRYRLVDRRAERGARRGDPDRDFYVDGYTQPNRHSNPHSAYCHVQSVSDGHRYFNADRYRRVSDRYADPDRDGRSPDRYANADRYRRDSDRHADCQ